LYNNGICERFHRTIQDKFYAVAFRKKIYTSIEELQQDVDQWIQHYNHERTYSGKYCFGKTPMQTFWDSLHLAKEKMLETHYQNIVSLPLSGEAEAGSAGEQPIRNSLTDWDSRGAEKPPPMATIPRVRCIRKRINESSTVRQYLSYYS